jgi:anaerobic C4-dicarboxylate transporter DcuA
MIFLQLAVLLICIFIGSRMSGIGLGVMGMIGLVLNHSFMLPGIITTAAAVIAGLILQSILL